jgi:hypothetical protein
MIVRQFPRNDLAAEPLASIHPLKNGLRNTKRDLAAPPTELRARLGYEKWI